MADAESALPFNATLEERVRWWLREHKEEHRSPMTGRVRKGLLAEAAARHFGLREDDGRWPEYLVQWVFEETQE